MIDVSDGNGNYVHAEKILDAVIRAKEQLPTLDKHIWHMSWSYVDGVLEQQNNLIDDPRLAVV